MIILIFFYAFTYILVVSVMIKKYMKYGKFLLLSFGILLLLTFIISIFNYFDILKENVFSIFKFIVIFLSFFTGGIYIGSNSLSKGYLSGLIGAFLGIVLAFIITILAKNLTVSFLYFILNLLIASLSGSIIGINLKQKK